MGRSSSRCPKCGRKVKYLFENQYESTVSKAGKNMVRYKGVKRALYCGECKMVYSLNLEQHQKSLRQKAIEEDKELYDVHKII